MKILSIITTTAIAVWILSILSFFYINYLGTAGFNKTAQETNFGNLPLFLVFFLTPVIIGIIAFFVGIISYIASEIIKNSGESKLSKKRFVLKFLLILIFFPLYLLFKIFNPLETLKTFKNNGVGAIFSKTKLHSILVRTKVLLVIVFIIVPVWAGTALGTIYFLGRQIGLVEVIVPVTGTGSMYPTIPKSEGKTPEEQAKEIVGTLGMTPYPSGISILGKRLFSHEIGRGDIVKFDNEKTRELAKTLGVSEGMSKRVIALPREIAKTLGVSEGMIKRVIALPGDSIEIEDGQVYLNGEALLEPYIARARSTFGGTFLADCHTLKIPEGKLFVMGDNRKGSGDSRSNIGLINYTDIIRVLALGKQKNVLDKNWRDSSNDLKDSSKIRVDKSKYLGLLNKKREDSGVKPLKYQSKLEQSSLKRGEIILKFNDFSFEATRSGYTMERALSDVGYTNIFFGEVPAQGYFEAEELIDNQFKFPNLKTILLNKDFQEIGIAEVEGEINGCPKQVLIQHLVSADNTDSWRRALSNLREIQSRWSNLKNYSDFYQKNKQDIDRLNEIIAFRITNIEGITQKMGSNQWLSQDQLNYTYSDQSLYEEQEAIGSKLNARYQIDYF